MSVKSTEGTGTLWTHVHPSQVPSCIGGTYNSSNDGKQPTNAWQFVCSKVVGGDTDAEAMAMDQREDSDREYMKKKSIPLVSNDQQQDNGNSKKEMGRQMLRRLSSKGRTAGTMIKSGVSKAKSGVTSAASASSKGISAAKTKIKEKRDERRAKKQMKDQKGGDDEDGAANDGDDDLSHKKTKPAERKSFSKRSEYVATADENAEDQGPEEKGDDVVEEADTEEQVQEKNTEQDVIENEVDEQKEDANADPATGDVQAEIAKGGDSSDVQADANEANVENAKDAEPADSVNAMNADSANAENDSADTSVVVADSQ